MQLYDSRIQVAQLLHYDLFDFTGKHHVCTLHYWSLLYVDQHFKLLNCLPGTFPVP